MQRLSLGDYIGHAEASYAVKIRPEISAKIIKVHFNDGFCINKSANLFTLNAVQFKAEVVFEKSRTVLNIAKIQLGYTKITALFIKISGKPLALAMGM